MATAITHTCGHEREYSDIAKADPAADIAARAARLCPACNKQKNNRKRNADRAHAESAAGIAEREAADRKRREEEAAFITSCAKYQQRRVGWSAKRNASAIERRLQAAGIEYSRYDAFGGSIYLQTDSLKIRFADHQMPSFGGYNVVKGERAGAADISSDPWTGLTWREVWAKIQEAG